MGECLAVALSGQLVRRCSKRGLSVVPPGVDGLSVELSTTVDIRDQANKELAMRLVTDIQSGDVFHTDLNGFQVSRSLARVPARPPFRSDRFVF